MSDPVKTDALNDVQKEQLKLFASAISKEVADVFEKKFAEANKPRENIGNQFVPRVIDGDKALPSGIGAARCVRYMAQAGGNDVGRAIDIARKAGDTYIADKWENTITQKAMAGSTLADGGAFLPPEFSQEIIQELGAQAVCRKLGISTLPMNNGSLTLPYFDTSATAYWVGENQNITASQPATAQLQMSNKALAALCPISNSLLHSGGAKVDAEIKNHLLRVVARKEDSTFIRGTGTQNSPQGFLYGVLAANKFNANASVTVANVTVDLGKAVGKLMSNDVDVMNLNCGWIISPRTYRYLHQATDANSNRVWQKEMDGGKIEGFPFAVTSQIPETLTSTYTEIYFVAFGSAVVGENQNLELAVFPGGAYYDGSNTVSGITLNQTVVRLIEQVDLGFRYRGKEISVIEQVNYGA